MTITKTKIIEAINAMPQQEFDDIDDALEEIVLITKIKKGLREMEEGTLIEEEEINKMIEQW